MRVVVTDRPFPDPNPYEGLIEEIKNLYDNVVEQAGGKIIYAEADTEEEAIEVCRGADVIITFVAPITSRVLDAAGNVDLVIRQGAGYDNVDVQAATERGIPVSNVPDYGSRDVASHGLALALAVSHDVVSADQKFRESQGWGSNRVIDPIAGGTYGIVGLGRIGRQAVPMARGLGMNVVAYDPPQDKDVFEMLDVESATFEELLDRSDCIVLHAALNEQTYHMFSTTEFERMNDDAILVNVARGPLVDESALIKALDTGKIRGAGLDVFEEEPPADSPLFDRENLVCSPHHAGSSPAAKENKLEIARAELQRVLNGEELTNVVNQEVFQYRG
jgi:D-3-phosphoglycerate dehydrogenase